MVVAAPVETSIHNALPLSQPQKAAYLALKLPWTLGELTPVQTAAHSSFLGSVCFRGKGCLSSVPSTLPSLPSHPWSFSLIPSVRIQRLGSIAEMVDLLVLPRGQVHLFQEQQ